MITLHLECNEIKSQYYEFNGGILLHFKNECNNNVISLHCICNNVISWQFSSNNHKHNRNVISLHCISKINAIKKCALIILYYFACYTCNIYILFNHKVNINFSQPKENDMSAFF